MTADEFLNGTLRESASVEGEGDFIPLPAENTAGGRQQSADEFLSRAVPARAGAPVQTIATTFGYRDAEDNGVGAPRLGSVVTNRPDVHGVALPEDVLRENLGDNPEDWRNARVIVKGPEGAAMVPIVDIGPGAGPRARGVGIDLTAATNAAVGGTGKTPVTYEIVKNGDLSADEYLNDVGGATARPAGDVIGDIPPPQVLPAGLVNPSKEVLAASFAQSIPSATDAREVNPVVRRAVPVDAAAGVDAGQSADDFLDGIAAPAAGEKPSELSLWEKIQKRWRSGREQAADDQLAYRTMTGEIPWDDVKGQLDPSEDMADAKGGNFASEGLLGAAEMLPAMIEGISNGWRQGLAGAGAGAAAAAVGGQLGPQVLAPEEVITVPVAAAGGYTVGQAYGSSSYWYKQGSGSLYHELRKEGVPHGVAQTVSAGFGVPYAAIEFAQVSKLIPGGSKTLARTVGQAVKRRLARVAAETGANYAEQIGQETSQELLQIGAESLAEWIGGVKPDPKKAGAWDRIKNTVLQTAASVPFLMAPRAGMDVVSVVRDGKANARAGAPVRPVAAAENVSNGQPAEAYRPQDTGAAGGDGVPAGAGAEGSAGMPGERTETSGQQAAGFDPSHPDAAYMPKPEGWQESAGAENVGEDYTREQATLPRAIEWLQPEQTGNPSPAGIRRYLKKTLDIAIRRGMGVSRGARSALGVYRVKAETIRMRAINDLPTLFHEVGHYLHYMIFPDGGDRSIAGDFAGVFDAELMPLGAATSLPTYTADKKRREGVAEFFRIWVADPAAARVAAPRFAAMFETAIDGQYPEIGKVLRSLQRQVNDYRRQPASAKAMGMIRWEPDQVDDVGPVGRVGDWLRAQYTAWFNELAPIDRAMRQLEGFGLAPARAREVSERAANYKGGWRGKAEYDFEHAQTDLDGKEIGPSLKSILSRVHDLKEFATYAALKRASEKKAQGFQTGFEDAMSAPDYAATMAEWSKVYETARRELVRFTENQTLLLEQSGLLSKADRKAMMQANRDYVPFHRIVENVTGAGGKSSGKGFANAQAGVARFKGSDMEITNPLEAVVKNGMMFRELAERNRVGRLFVEAVDDTQGGGRIGEVLRPIKAVKVTHDEVLQKLQAAGVLPKGAKISKAMLDLGMTVFRAADSVKASEGVFTVHMDGKPVSFQVEDKELLRALTLMDSADAEVFNKFPLLRMMRAFTNVLRKGATLTPEFLIRNPFRDQIIAGVYSKHGFIPFWDGFRGTLSMLRQDSTYRAWIKAGGKYSGLYDVEQGDHNAALQAAVQGNRTALEQALYLSNPLNVLKQLQAASELMESGTRISEFRRAKAAGLSDVEAGNAARDVTLNFARGGYRGAVANKMVAFFNAALQDMDKMVRTFKERPVAATFKAVAYISVPSAFVWWLGKDDDEIQNLPEWRKSFFWNINMRQIGGVPFILSVPKPFLLGALFGKSVEKGLDAAYLTDPNAVNKWFSAVIQNTLLRGDAGIPTAFKPMIEGMTNYSFFKGAPLENQSMQALSPGMRANPSTSEVAKLVGSQLNVSPILIDNTVRGYLGGLGKYGLDAVDYALIKSRAVDVPPPPAKDPQEWPMLRALASGPAESSAYVSRFYKALDLAETRMRDFKAYGDRMQTRDQADFWRKNRNQIAYYSADAGGVPVMTRVRQTRDQLSEINKAMLMVRNARGLSPEFKRDRLRVLADQRDTMAKAAFTVLVHPADRKKTY